MTLNKSLGPFLVVIDTLHRFRSAPVVSRGDCAFWGCLDIRYIPAIRYLKECFGQEGYIKIERLGAGVVVAHPFDSTLAAGGRVRTDIRPLLFSASVVGR